jgi:hypothetical protein
MPLSLRNTAFVPVLWIALNTPVSAAAPSAPAGGSDQLERCRALKAQIERYTRLRQSGGSSVQMERWRRSRKAHEAEFRTRRCVRLGRQLRRNR